MVWRAKSKPANHEAESAYITGEGGAAENVIKFSEICVPLRGETRCLCLSPRRQGQDVPFLYVAPKSLSSY